MKMNQQGVISLTWASYLFSLSVIIVCAVKIVPVYVEHMYIKEAMQFVLDNNSNLAEVDKTTIKNSIWKYASINSLSKRQKDSFEVVKIKGGYLVNSIYEVRAPLMHNLDVVISFKQQLDTTNPDACCEYLVEKTSRTKK